jgi:porphobilinogen synthase
LTIPESSFVRSREREEAGRRQQQEEEEQQRKPPQVLFSPTERPRRLRKTEALRTLTSETTLSINGFVLPYFVTFGRNIKEPIPSMPGCFRFSPDLLVKEIEESISLGIKSVLLFGLPKRKDDVGSGAYDRHGIIQETARLLKSSFPELLLIGDVCLCEYTSHGHCGVVDNNNKGEIRNDETLVILGKIAVSQAEAGIDVVGPSGMMDGQVRAIRESLDEYGYSDTAIMSYSAKYASSFYGPFREAADSAPAFGNRRTYQMNPENVREAMREIALDIKEGADIVMVKPALAYLDVVSKARNSFDVPLAVYNVSGEYSIVKAGAQKGWINERGVVLEMLTSMKRAGADIIITYFAKDAARWLMESNEK